MGEFAINAKPIDTYLESQTIRDRPHLKIKNTAFSKDFLFYGTFIPMLNSTTGHSLKGRIIRFQIFADRVIMLESAQGHSIGENSENLLLLAEFPIVQSDNDGVVIDFAKGMNTAFTMRNVHSRSVSDKDSGTAEQFRAIFLSASFVKAIEADQDALTISQIAQWRNQQSELISAEFRYFLREYLPSPTFMKSTFGKNRFVQYFSTPPLVKAPTTQPFAYIAKWDINKPIVFYLSSNTPHEYRGAIKDGLLFWNHIFGKKVVEVRDLEPGLSAPHPSLNIIQWVPWDNEASAYADMVVDHLTGEVLQAYIYLRSGWVIQSARKLRNHLEELFLTDQQPGGLQAIEEDVPLPSMFDLEIPCLQTMNNFEELAELATNLTTSSIKSETLFVLSGDILRAVIAHEMGHVLGLRHNLGASTNGTISLAERDRLLKNYLQTGTYDLSHDKFFSKSIMDVFSASDDAIVGAQIRELLQSEDLQSSRLRAIYDYDRQAIDYGYFNKPMEGNIVFCTDDDINRYLDCRRWDASDTPLLFASTRLNTMMTQVAIVLADTFIAAIDGNRPGGPLKVRDISLTNQGVVKILEQYVKELFAWFNQASRSAQIEASFPAFGPQNDEEITTAKWKSIRDQVAVNGVSQTLFAMLPPFQKDNLNPQHHADIFRAHFLARLDELKSSNNEFTFSSDEQEEAFAIARAFFEDLHKEITSLIARTIGRAQFDDPEFQIPIEEALGKIAHELVLATDSSDNASALPHFRYDLKTRDAGATLLNPALGLLADWSFENLQNITNELKTRMRRFGAAENATTIDLNSMTRQQRQWIMEQNRILSTLTQMRTMARKLTPTGS